MCRGDRGQGFEHVARADVTGVEDHVGTTERGHGLVPDQTVGIRDDADPHRSTPKN